MHRVEFTIEPFVEGHPGPHVTETVAALEALGVAVAIGPFGSGCDVDDARAGEIVAAIVQTALEHGATHVNVDVGRVDESGSAT